MAGLRWRSAHHAVGWRSRPHGAALAREAALRRTSAREVRTHDGRLLTVDVTGAGHGVPVFLLHGTPGSRNGPKPRGAVLYRLGVQLISYDRPGYGGSTPKQGRTVAEAARDVEAIANELGIGRFAVVGRSGGGPHALACARLLPKRVVRTAVLVSVAQVDAAGLDWFAGMAPSNIDDYRTAMEDQTKLIQRLRVRAHRTNRDPESMLALLIPQMSGPDRRVVGDIGIRRLILATYAEALRHGPDGWIDDVLALRGDWGFDLRGITGPVLLWHGEDDTFAPVSHTHWLADQIAGSEVRVQSGAAHFGAVEILPQILPWLTTWGEEGQRESA